MRRLLRLRYWVVTLGALLAAGSWGFDGDMRAWGEVRNPTGVAVIIGNRDYEHRDVPDVVYAHRDADAFRGYVLAVLGFDPKNVIDLRDATRRVLYDALGTRSDPSGSLVWSYLDPDGGSDVVVFYSGHGVPGQRDRRGYLLPVDADPKAAEDDGYPIDLLYKNLSGLAEAASVQVFLDACFSGGSHEGGLIGSASPVFVEAALPEGTVDKVTSVTAASGKQIASWDETARHGLFTHHLLDALYGGADENKDGRVTAQEAKGYLDRRMTRAARRMHRRVQRASLMGSGEAVLASVVQGQEFPARSELDVGSGAAGGREGKGEGEKTAKAGGREASRSAVRALVSAEKAPDHVAAEAALGLERDARVQIQRGLAVLKQDVGYADGLFGKKTRGAIRAWQEGKGFEATGYLTQEQAEALRAVGMEMDEERRKAEAERQQRQAQQKRQRLAREAVERARREREEELRVGRKFRDCEECPELVVVPAGRFRMGSPSGEEGRYGDEGPVHGVRITEPFAVGVYEVTFEEWEACVGGGGCGGYRPDDEGWGQGVRPVINVSWEEAKAYVEWLSRETGKEYRLLSEAEWEYVARAGTRTRYGWGDGTGRNRANCRSCGSRWDNERTAPVGSFRANGFGLHDVHGNVWEWVEDCWNGSYAGAPTDGSARESGNCTRRVLRGGSWDVVPRNLRSASRSGDGTGDRVSNLGFRVARTLTR